MTAPWNNLLGYLTVFLLCVFVVICPYASSSAVKAVFIAAAAAWLIRGLGEGGSNLLNRLVPRNPVSAALCVFAAACLLSVIFSASPYQGQKIFFSRYIWFILMFSIGAGIARTGRNGIQVLRTTFIISSFFLASGAIHDFIVFKPLRLFTVFGGEIAFCMLPLFITYMLPLNFAFFLFGENRWVKACGIVNAALLATALVMQMSRTGWIAASLSILLLSMLKNRRWLVLSLAAVMILLTAGLITPRTRALIRTIPHPAQWNYRVPLYDSALAMFRDRPVFGVGLGMYQVMIKTDKYDLPSDYPSGNRDLYLHAHNLYFELLAETGIVGLAAFLAVFAAFVFFLRKNLRLSPPGHKDLVLGITAVIAATLVFGIAGSIILVGITDSMLFWLMFGVAVGLLAPADAAGDREMVPPLKS